MTMIKINNDCYDINCPDFLPKVLGIATKLKSDGDTDASDAVMDLYHKASALQKHIQQHDDRQARDRLISFVKFVKPLLGEVTNQIQKIKSSAPHAFTTAYRRCDEILMQYGESE